VDEHRRRCGGVRLLGGVDLASMQIAGRVQDAVVAPLVEVAPDGAPGREIPGLIPPLAARTEDGEDGIDDVTRVGLARSPAGVNGGMRWDQSSPHVGDVAGIMVRANAPF
jgi:hypothetical protein